MSIQLCMRSVEFRAATSAADGDGHTLEGYAVVFDQAADINTWEGTFRETFTLGAIRKTLRERRPIMQFNHGHDQRTGAVPIGVYTELREDAQGLYVLGRLFDNPVVEPVRQAIESQAVTGMSMSFRVIRDEWRDNAGKLVKGDEINRLLWEPGERGPLHRTVKEVQLAECGPVVYPAYEGTSVGVRSVQMTDNDRAALVAEYRRTMIAQDADESPPTTDRDHPITTETFPPQPEKTSTEGNAVPPEDTLPVEPPEDAAREGTSHRDEQLTPQQQEREDVSVPMPRKADVMNIDELRARAKEIAERLTTIGTEYRDSALPEAEQTEWDSLETELTEVERQVTAIDTRAARLLSLVVAKPAITERGSDTGAPKSVRKVDNIFDLDEIRARSTSADDYAGLLRDNAMRAVEAARFSRVATDKAAAQENIERMLDNIDDPAALSEKILITGSPLYERAFGKMLKACTTAGLSPEEQRAMTLGTDAQGGYAVPFQLDPTVILTNAGTINPLRQISRIEQITGKEWQGITSAGVSVTRATEGAAATDNSFTLIQKPLRVNRVQGFIPFSIEIDQDWGQLRSEITRLLADAKEREENTSFTLGDGTGVNANGVVATLSANTVTGSGGAASFVANDVYALESAMAPRFRANGSFLASKTIYNKVRQFDTSNGPNLWERIGKGIPPELLGYSAYEASDMATALTTGAKILLFGDFSQFLILDRIGMQVELIPQVFNASGMPTGQRGIYAIWRNNSKILVDAAFKLLVTA